MLIKGKQMKKMPEDLRENGFLLPDDVILVHSVRRWGFLTIKKMDSVVLPTGWGQQKIRTFDSITRIPLTIETKHIK